MAVKIIALLAIINSLISSSLSVPRSNQAFSILRARQVIPQPPVYVAISDGAYDDYTLLKVAGGSNHVVTAGPADPYTAAQLPPRTALQGEFVGIDDNIFVPDNRALRRPFENWEIGIIKVGDQCLKATLKAPYVTVAACQKGVLNDKSLTWINWGYPFNRGLGGYIQPYGNQNATVLLLDLYPSPSLSWGLKQNQKWRSSGQLIEMASFQGSHITILGYNSQGPRANQTVGF